MSDTLHRSRDSFVARYEGLRDRLPGSRGEREVASASFRRLGLPGPRDEVWRYTNVRRLAETMFHEPVLEVAGQPGALSRVPALACPRLIYVDGRFRADLSDASPFVADAPRAGSVGLTRPDRDTFAAMNTMLSEDGARISVPAGVDGGMVLIVSLASDVYGRAVAFHPRHHIELAAHARLTVIEIALGDGTYLHNPVTEVVVGADATLTHLHLQDEASSAFHVGMIYAEVGAGGHYESFLLNMGAALSRTEVHARIGGPGGVVHLNCAQLLRGTQHGDFTTVLSHDAPGGQSRQTVRNVLDDAARGVFQGRINVARIAQQTDGYQMNHTLLLSPQAEIDSKPELRINADDVKCSHGATVGALDADQLFYLRSRGVHQADARAMLIRGFLSESIAEVADAAARSMYEQAVDRWWQRADKVAA